MGIRTQSWGALSVFIVFFDLAFRLCKGLFFALRSSVMFAKDVCLAVQTVRRGDEQLDSAKSKLDAQATSGDRKQQPVSEPMQPQPAAAAASAPTKRAAPVEDEKQARVVGRAEEPVAPEQVATKRSGLHACDVEIADQHAQRKIGKQWYRFSLYRDAGKVLRFDLKAGVELPPFLRSTAAEAKMAFSLEDAVRFTALALIAAKKQPATTGAGKRTRTDAKNAPMETAPAADDGGAHFDDVPFADADWYAGHTDAGAEPMPYHGDMPAVSRGPEPTPTSKLAQEEVHDEPPDWEPDAHQGVIADLYWQNRKGPGSGYSTYTMAVDTVNGRKEFNGAELQSRVKEMKLHVGDTITIRKGVQPFYIINTARERQDRTRNVFQIKLIAKALVTGRRASNG